MADVVRARRHSTSTPMVLCRRPFPDGNTPRRFGTAVPLKDIHNHGFPIRRSLERGRVEPPSPVDSVLSPDPRFPQGGERVPHGKAARARARAPPPPLLRPRSQSVGGRPSRHARPSLEEVRYRRDLAWRGVAVPAAPRALVTAHYEFRDLVQALRRGFLTRPVWLHSPAGPGLRALVRVARDTELDLLAVVHPLPGSRELGLTPADCQHLASMVNAAAAALGRARRRVLRCSYRFCALRDWLAHLDAQYGSETEHLPMGLSRSLLYEEVEREKERLLNDLADRVLPVLTRNLHVRVQDIWEFLAQKGVHREADTAMHGALPVMVPGESQRHEAGGALRQQEVQQRPWEPVQTPRDDALRGPGYLRRRQRLRWAYLRLRYGALVSWPRIDHQAAQGAFVKFQDDLTASVAAGEEPSTEMVLLLRKAETRARWHAWQLAREEEEEEEEEEEGEEEEEEEEEEQEKEEEQEREQEDSAPGAKGRMVASKMDEWAAQLSRSLRAARRPGGGRDSPRTPWDRSAPDSKRDSGVGCATPTPAGGASGSCVDLMQRAGMTTQRRRRADRGVTRRQ